MPPTIRRPSWLFETTWIYHITAIENLPNILRNDGLYATNNRPCEHASIAHEEIQDYRAGVRVSKPPRGTLHDYVPFYFAPRSPMLRKNAYAHRRRDAGFPNAKAQTDIVHLVSYAELFDENEVPFVFFTRHAANALADCCNDITELGGIEWDLFFEAPFAGEYAKYWQDHYDNPRWVERKSIRQAEFLVHNFVDWSFIQKIGTVNDDSAARVRRILADFDDETEVAVKRDWYHLDLM